MLTLVGTYENGQVVLLDKPPVQKKMTVYVTFVEEEPTGRKQRTGGSMAGEIQMADDFNAPLDDLGDYM